MFNALKRTLSVKFKCKHIFLIHTSVLFNKIRTNCNDTIGSVMHVVSDKK